MRLNAFLILPVLAGVLAADDHGGIAPRGSASDYPAHETGGGLTLAAAVVPPGQVSKTFAADLNKLGYIVVEVAVFPENGGEVNLRTRDFLLRAGSDPATLRPVTPETITARIQQKNAPAPPKLPGNVQVHTTSTIGYESGPYGRGVYTATGVGVGVGEPPPPPPPPPGSAGRDPAALERELADKALPETQTTAAIGGYLYFPKPEKNGPYTLTYAGEHATVRLTIPTLKKSDRP